MPASQPDAESVIRIADTGADWRARESWVERLFGPGAPDWFALEHEARARRVKTGHARAIWRVTLDCDTIYVKVLDIRSAAERMKSRLLGSAAEREWRASREAERRGISVVRALAVGVRGGNQQQAVFLSEELDGAVALPAAWERDVARASWRRRRAAAGRLIDAVACLFAVAHERGFVHRDPHPGNILVRSDSSKTCEAVFADVHPAAISRAPTSTRRTVRALAQLDHFFQRLATRTERLRFLKVYAARRAAISGGQPTSGSDRETLTAVMRARTAHAVELARQRNRRLRRDGKYFCTLRLGDAWKATVTLRLERRHVFPEPDVPDRSATDWRELLVPALSGIAGATTGDEPIGSMGIRFEASRPSGFLERLWWTLARPPDLRAFEACHRRRHRDEAAELVLGYAEHRKAGLIDATLLILADRPGNDRDCARCEERNRA